MSLAVSQLLASLDRLSAAERYEFLSTIALPTHKSADDWSDDDFTMAAAQTFARLDAEEEEYVRTQSSAK